MSLTVNHFRITSGGGIDFEEVSATGTLLVFDTTVSNTNYGSAGGFVPLAPGAFGTVLTTTSTGVEWLAASRPRIEVDDDALVGGALPVAYPNFTYGVTTTAAVEITLPAVGAVADGMRFFVKNELGARGNAITVKLASGQSWQDGTTTDKTITAAYGFLDLYYKNTKWFDRP